LNCSLRFFFKVATPLSVTLPIMKRIRIAIPKMQRIWANSAMANQGRDTALNRTLEMEKGALELIEKGEFTLDMCMSPQL